MRFDGQTSKRKITKWGLDELSSVKTGAQSHAKATILKTAGDETDAALLEAGFTYDECAVVKSAIDPTGDIPEQISALAMQFGKTCDTISSVSKTNTEDTDMSDKTPEQLQKELDDATARVTELETLAKMSDAEKSYMDKMSDEDKKKFMAMDTEGRKKQMGVAKANDESFTDTLGQVIRKSEVGENAFIVMKSQHERLAKMEEEAANREALELVKSLCPTLPGTDEAKATALRKCRTSLSTEEFETLEKALKAGEEAMKGRMVVKAHDAPVGNDDALAKFNDGIAKIMSDKQISKSAAMSSPEGLKLAKTYQEAIKEESE